jgi:hypothetical protein
MADDELHTTIAAARQKILTSLAMDEAGAHEPELTCLRMIQRLLPVIYTALDEFAPCSEHDAEVLSGQLEAFAEVILPRAFAYCAVAIIAGTTPQELTLESVASFCSELEKATASMLASARDVRQYPI